MLYEQVEIMQANGGAEWGAGKHKHTILFG